MRGGQLPEALKLAQHAVAINPAVADSHTQLGTVWLLLGDYAAAERELTGALQRDASQKYAAYNLACVYSRTGRHAEAFAILHKLCSQTGEFQQGIRDDPELAALRADPAYSPRLTELARE
jgi:Flp pilus assembly protein TadD